MGRAINMENDLYKMEAEVDLLKGRVSLLEKAIEAGRKKPSKKKAVKKETKDE